MPALVVAAALVARRGLLAASAAEPAGRGAAGRAGRAQQDRAQRGSSQARQLSLPGALSAAPPGPPRRRPEEKHFRNLRQLTFGGQNAEGYWSPDGKQIIYQRMNEAEGVMCDQEYVVELATGKSRRVSNGKGRVTCGYFTDGGRRVLYASTHLARRGLPAAGRSLEGLLLADGDGLRHRQPRARRLGLPPPDRHARLRRRGDALARRQDDRVHLRPRRRSRDLHDGDRRLAGEAPHPRARLRRRAVLLARRQAHRLPPRRAPRRREPRALPGAARAEPLPARVPSRSG